MKITCWIDENSSAKTEEKAGPTAAGQQTSICIGHELCHVIFAFLKAKIKAKQTKPTNQKNRSRCYCGRRIGDTEGAEFLQWRARHRTSAFNRISTHSAALVRSEEKHQ